MNTIVGFTQGLYCPPNIDFEMGNFNNWSLYTGSCCPITTPVNSGAIANRHTITSGVGVDPYGKFPVVDPTKGLYSLKLGNNLAGAQAERARYYVRVPANLNNYSLLLKYAVVLENPTHPAKDQPRFEIKAYDSITNNPISCAQFSFVASSSLPGFQLSALSKNVYYKTWSMASLNLSGYGGRTVAVDFASGDCAQGLHFGYGYVDVNCVLFEINAVVCKGSQFSTLTAPPGFAHYQWYDSTYTTLLDTNMVAHVPTPVSYNKFNVILTAYPGYGCDDTLTSSIYVSDVKLKLNKDTFVCAGKPIQLVDSATASARFLPLTYSWNPSSTLSCNNCLNPIASPTTTSKYVLTVTDASSCVLSDSLTVSIRRDSIVSQPTSLIRCKGGSATFRVVAAGKGYYTYQWLKNGVNISGANKDSLRLSPLSYADSGAYAVWVKWGCDSVLSASATLSFYPPPSFSVQPATQNVCLGASAIFRSRVNASSAITYQWKKNGVPISGANADSLQFTTVANSDTALYQLMAFTACDTVYSDTARLTLKALPVILSQPASGVQCPGLPFTFRVVGSAAIPASYQWKKNGVNITGATADSLRMNAVSVADTGSYTVTLTGICGSINSSNATLAVQAQPIINLQPQSVTQCLNQPAKFWITGVGINRYQWFHNSVAIVGAIRDTFTIATFAISDTGTYQVKVWGNCDSLLSGIANLSRIAPPIITQQPTSKTVCVGNKAVYRVAASSVMPLSYQWKRNGVILSSTTDSLVINAATANDSGSYQVMVKTTCDSLLSSSASLTINPSTAISVQPQNHYQCAGDTFSFRVTASGLPPFTYQWFKKGNPITGANADSLRLMNVQTSDTGNYTVAVIGGCGAATSNGAVLQLNVPLVINTQPVGVQACIGSRVVLRVLGSGYNTLQWFKGSQVIGSANADSLVITSIATSDTGSYSVQLKNACDTLRSNLALVSLNPSTTITQQPVPDTVCVGTQAIFKVKANGAGSLTYQWRHNGVNIAGAINDSFNINATQLADTGLYQVQIGSACGILQSVAVPLILKGQPIVAASSPDLLICPGSEAMFTVVVQDQNPVIYQWKKDGISLPGAQKDTFFIVATQPSDTGLYNVSITGSCGVINSSPVKLSLIPLSNFTLQPSGLSACVGSNALIRVKGASFTALQWYKNNLALPFATSDSIVFAPIALKDTGTYSVQLLGDCNAAFSQSAKVMVNPLPQINWPDSMVVCSNQNILSLPGYAKYLWSTGSKTASTAINQAGKLWVQVKDSNQCANTDSTLVNFKTPAIVNAGNDTIQCNQADLQLHGMVTNADAFNWVSNSNGTFTNLLRLDPIFTPAKNTVGVMYLTLAATNQCGVVYDSVAVDLRDKLLATYIMQDTLVCEGSPAIGLTPLQPGGQFTGKYVSGNTFDPIRAGTYPITYQLSAYGCSDAAVKNITVVQVPVASFTVDPKSPTIDDTVTFTSTSQWTERVLWDIETGVGSSLNQCQWMFPKEGIYKVFLTAYNSICVETTSKEIKILGSDLIWVPNAFTPNGDGNNDEFHVIFRNSNGGTLSIYDRWGELVYWSDDLTQGWNGQFNGNACPIGVYVYVVQYKSNKKGWQTLKGNVTLLN